MGIDAYKDVEIDDLLIYYTGHGRLFNDVFELQMSEKIGITLDKLYGYIKQNFENHALLPKRIAIVVDACYSGQAVKKTTMQFGTSEILTSSLEGMKSFETGFPNGIKSDMSLFSHYFCDAIETLQVELEEINLSNIQTHINKYVEKQISPRGLVDELGYMPMTIAKGNLKKENHTDAQSIYIYFELDLENNTYLITVNNDLLTKKPINAKSLEEESIHEEIITKIKELTDDLEDKKPRVEVFLPKEAYGIVFPLWHDELDEYQVYIRSYVKLDASVERIKRNQIRWNSCYLNQKDMSYRHNHVTVVVSNKARQSQDRISLIVEKKVEKDSKVYEGIENSYFIALWIKEDICEDEYSKLLDALSSSKLCNVGDDIDRKIVDSDGSCIEKLSFMWDNPNILPIRENKYE